MVCLVGHSAIDQPELTGFHYSPDESCTMKSCSKSCFARHCFDWCITHSYPSMETKDGERSVVVVNVTEGAEGQPISKTEVEQRRVCGHQDAVKHPGDCNIVTSPFLGIEELWEFETEQYMSNVMARDSP